MQHLKDLMRETCNAAGALAAQHKHFGDEERAAVFDNIADSLARQMNALMRLGPITVTCRVCKTPHTISAPMTDIAKWRNGELIQNVMPYLPPDVRELLISGTCGSCFEEMFPDA